MPKKMSGREARLLRILRTRAIRIQSGFCYWCKKPMHKDAPDTDPLQATGDHLIPLHAGGKTVPGNIVAACRDCNNGRHPELKPMGGGIVAQSGDPTSHSPFAVLRGAVS